LVETMHGGSARSGARLSETGAQILDAYRALQQGAQSQQSSPHWGELSAKLLAEPRPHQ
jgi:molybdate transport system regulatory protein